MSAMIRHDDDLGLETLSNMPFVPSCGV